MIPMYPHLYGAPLMLETHTTYAFGLPVTIASLEGTDASGVHYGVLSLPADHPDAKDVDAWDVSLSTSASLVSITNNHAPVLVRNLPEWLVPGYTHLTYQFTETDALTAQAEMSRIAGVFASRDTLVRRFARWLPDWLRAFGEPSWLIVAVLLTITMSIDSARNLPEWILWADAGIISAFLTLTALGLIKTRSTR